MIGGSFRQPFSFNSVSLSGKDFFLEFLPAIIPYGTDSSRIKPDWNRRKVLDWKICFSLDQQVLAFGTFTLPKPKMAQPTKQNQNKMITHELVQRSFWPYSPAILQVKVFYSSSIVLENRIACERCQKYFKVKLNDLPTVYDHWLKVTGLLIKIPDRIWWIPFIDDDRLPEDDIFFIKIGYFISRSYILSSDRLAQRQKIFLVSRW